MMNTQTTYDINKFFKAISDQNRVKIMDLLKDGEMNVSEICKHFEMSQPSISHHLGILKNADIVRDHKVGKEVFYYLNEICISNCCGTFSDRYSSKK